jgi:hypothetical protein
MKVGEAFPDENLRDEFAALALKEILRAGLQKPLLFLGDKTEVAEEAYGFADAMMKARLKR